MCNGRAAYSSATSYRLVSRPGRATTAMFSILLHALSIFIIDRRNHNPNEYVRGVDQDTFSVVPPTTPLLTSAPASSISANSDAARKTQAGYLRDSLLMTVEETSSRNRIDNVSPTLFHPTSKTCFFPREIGRRFYAMGLQLRRLSSLIESIIFGSTKTILMTTIVASWCTNS